jgi:hypothetical protein
LSKKDAKKKRTLIIVHTTFQPASVPTCVRPPNLLADGLPPILLIIFLLLTAMPRAVVVADCNETDLRYRKRELIWMFVRNESNPPKAKYYPLSQAIEDKVIQWGKQVTLKSGVLLKRIETDKLPSTLNLQRVVNAHPQDVVIILVSGKS